MAGNGNKAVFDEGKCCPSVLTFFGEPLMGRLVMDMHRISQGKKQIDVEKIDRHGVLSRSWLTNSRVTIPASGWTGKSGRPSFFFTEGFLVNDFRARSESTRPSVNLYRRAISLAARRTSSSISTVVRMGSSKMCTGFRFSVPLGIHCLTCDVF